MPIPVVKKIAQSPRDPRDTIMRKYHNEVLEEEGRQTTIFYRGNQAACVGLFHNKTKYLVQNDPCSKYKWYLDQITYLIEQSIQYLTVSGKLDYTQ